MQHVIMLQQAQGLHSKLLSTAADLSGRRSEGFVARSGVGAWAHNQKYVTIRKPLQLQVAFQEGKEGFTFPARWGRAVSIRWPTEI
jgi:hypothetical protein